MRRSAHGKEKHGKEKSSTCCPVHPLCRNQHNNPYFFLFPLRNFGADAGCIPPHSTRFFGPAINRKSAHLFWIMSRLHLFALSEKGLRDNNEDDLCAERIGDYHVLAVSDGLGGHECGEVASGIAIGCLKNAVRFYEGDIRSLMRNAVFDADEQILAVSEASREKRGMATTLVAACVDDNLACTVANIGDSRAHIISATDVKTTKDHSLVNQLLDAGEITPEEAWQHPMSMVLTRALGDPDSDIEPDFYEVNLEDTFLLLSSDGLHDFLPKERIRTIVLANKENVEKSARDLVREALLSGSDDNITVVLAYGEPGPVPADGT